MQLACCMLRFALGEVGLKLKNLIYAAMFAALTFVVTAFVKIPLPSVGYVHLGDVFVFAAGALLPLPYAACASALGGALADLAAGYADYMVVTAVVKAAMAAVVWLIGKRGGWRLVVSLAVSTVVLAAGYYAYEWIKYGFTVAIANVPFNLLQGAVCAVVAFPLAVVAQKYLIKTACNEQEESKK